MSTDVPPTTATPPAGRSKGKMIGIGAAVLLLGCCGLFAISLMMGGGDDPPATTQAPAADAPAGDVATDAPAAEDTAVPATDEPAEDPDDEAVCEYVAWVAQTVTPMGTAIGGIGTALTDAGKNPALLGDADWRIRVAAGLAMLNLSAEEVRNRDQADVPDAALKLHVQLGQLATTVDSIATNLTTGLDDMDSEKIAAANTSMGEIPELTTAMTDELKPLAVGCPGQ